MLDTYNASWLSNVRSAAVEVSVTGDTIIIPANPGYKIRVYGWDLTASDAVTIRFKDTDGTVLRGAVTMAAYGSTSRDPANGIPWFTAPEGKGVVINLSASGVTIGGTILYSN